MKAIKITLFSALLLSFGIIFSNNTQAQTYENEVRQSGTNYIWRVNGTDQGTTSDFGTAFFSAIGSGNRDVHILCNGTLNGLIKLPDNLKIDFHNHTLIAPDGGYIYRDGGFNITIQNLNTVNISMRTSASNSITVRNLNMKNGGMRFDAFRNNPWAHPAIKNLTLNNITIDSCGGHAIETYNVDGCYIDSINVSNAGGCGLLLNATQNGTVGTVRAYNCCYGGGYAGFRLANGCVNIMADSLFAEHCGRGFFIVKSGPTVDCHLNYAKVIDCADNWGWGRGVWLENAVNCSVESGCSDGGISFNGENTYANVSPSCDILTTFPTGSANIPDGTIVQIKNRATGLLLDSYGQASNGGILKQVASTSTSDNSKWLLINTEGFHKIQNIGTKLMLDCYGYREDGSNVYLHDASSSHVNGQWAFELIDRDTVEGGAEYYRIHNHSTGLFIDGLGRTSNGSNAGQLTFPSTTDAQWELIPATPNTAINAAIAINSGSDIIYSDSGAAINKLNYKYMGVFNDIVWSGDSDTVPDGIEVKTSGGYLIISGTPTETGTFVFNIDIDGINGGRNVSTKGKITVGEPTTITKPTNTVTFPDGIQVRIKNRGTGLLLDSYGETGNGFICRQSESINNNTKWKLVKYNNFYKIVNVGSGIMLDGFGYTNSGANMTMYDANSGSDNGLWVFELHETIGDTTYYRIQNLGSGMYIDGIGRTTIGDFCGQMANPTTVNGQWLLIADASVSLLSGIEKQSVEINEHISTIKYSYVGSFDTITWTGSSDTIPSGIKLVVNATGNKILISGKPTIPGDYNYTLYFDGLNGGRKTSVNGTITVTTPTGLSQNPQDDQSGVVIYPNPTSGLVTINIPEGITDGTLNIMTINGIQMKALKLTGESQMKIDMSVYPKGVYQICLINKDKTITGKVVVK
ncbi:MAG: RICIN domain-containing protein [Marinilabiliaceae bacterium]|nr:RICIN domain-containing protein [Marinilabiliaceae bacterium]